jgi:hypothetical protein
MNFALSNVDGYTNMRVNEFGFGIDLNLWKQFFEVNIAIFGAALFLVIIIVVYAIDAKRRTK